MSSHLLSDNCLVWATNRSESGKTWEHELDSGKNACWKFSMNRNGRKYFRKKNCVTSLYTRIPHVETAITSLCYKCGNKGKIIHPSPFPPVRKYLSVSSGSRLHRWRNKRLTRLEVFLAAKCRPFQLVFIYTGVCLVPKQTVHLLQYTQT